MKQQIEQLLKTVQKRQAKISEEQAAMDEEIQQIEKMIKGSKKFAKGGFVPEKTFEDYCYEYGAVPGIGLDTPPEQLVMRDKFGLLWYMIKDKKGGLVDFLDIICVITHSPPDYRDVGTDVGKKVFKLLPKEFINSFEDY